MVHNVPGRLHSENSEKVTNVGDNTSIIISENSNSVEEKIKPTHQCPTLPTPTPNLTTRFTPKTHISLHYVHK